MAITLRNIDFIGIGVFKSATSTIASLLADHPDICFSVPKEVRYFNSDDGGGSVNGNQSKSLDWYFNHFNHYSNEKIIGEFSPIYFKDELAPKRIHDAFPNAKLLICIRNPVDRAFSHYNMLKYYVKSEKNSFDQALLQNSDYIENGLYYKHIMRYLDYFAMENIHIMVFEDIRDNIEVEIKKLYRFLNVKDTFVPKSLHEKTNPSKRTRFNFLRLLQYKSKRWIAKNGGGSFINWLKKNNIHTLIERLYSKPFEYPKMKKEDALWLKQQFSSDIQNLEKLLGRDFSIWTDN